MSQVFFIFAVGLSGVFFCMALLFTSIKFTAAIINILKAGEEKK